MESVCGDCLTVVPGSITETVDGVVLTRRCDFHGEQSILVEPDVNFFRSQPLFVGDDAALRTYAYERGTFLSSQPVKAAVIEVTDDCNESCKTCIAGSLRGRGTFKTVEEITRQNTAACRDAGVQVLVVSGGEPTIHPQIEEVLELAFESPALHVVLISNGRRFVEEPAFATRLKASFPDLEVFLQFDSLRPEVMVDLRGSDLVPARTSAAYTLAESEIDTTFVSIAKTGPSIEFAGELIEFASALPNVRGVNFQPLRASGRHEGTTVDVGHAPSIGQLIHRLADQVSWIRPDDFVPHPVAPGTIAVSYWGPRTAGDACTTRESLRGLSQNGSYVHPFVPPSAPSFRILILNYMDRLNLRSDLVSQAPIFLVTSSLDLVPLDLYYLLGEPPSLRRIPVSFVSDERAGRG